MKRMNKWVVAGVLVAEILAAVGAWAEPGARVTVGGHGGVQLWEGGPYWAETNIGAEKPWEYGLYFWWGDTVGYKWENEAWVASDGAASNFSFSEGNTPTYNKDSDQLKSEGWITADGVLSPEHDAAQVQWGGGWRMPTGEEFDDLCYDKCDWTWMTTNGVNGYVVRGRGDFAGASIFIPASGYISFGRVHDSAESNAFLWSSSVRDTVSWCLVFGSDHHDVGPYARWCGYSIRPVRGGGEAPPPPGEGANVSVTNVTARQRYPWNGLVDITCTVEGIEGEAEGLKFSVAAVEESGKVRRGAHVRVVRDGAESEDLEVRENGEYRLVWDARADLGAGRWSNLVVRVTFDAHNGVQLWENGPFWAEMNIGAEEPWEYGLYFWWGDTVGYRRVGSAWVASDGAADSFSFSSENTPTYGKTTATLQSEGWTDASGNLAPEHDAAQAHWGGGWRMPTDAEFAELISNTTTIWTNLNGVYGRLVTGKGDYAAASIFLPAAGSGSGTSLGNSGSYGIYWSSTPLSPSDDAWDLYFYSAYFYRLSYGFRLRGQSVRALRGFAE